MGTQTATLGDLEKAQNIILAECRYTAEHNAPCVNLVEHFKLGKGQYKLTMPKVASVDMADLTDGVDITEELAIGLTYTDLTTSEVGGKFVVTDKLIRQFNEDVFRVIGRQMGDAMGRKKDKDVIALFSALNGGTALGADGTSLTAVLASTCIAYAKANKYPAPVFIVHHPNAVYGITSSVSITPGSSYPIPHGFAEDLLKDYYRITLNQVAVFEDGNIAKISGVDSAYGVIASKSAMAFIESQAPATERERDASLRAWEVVMVSDYGCFEIDDSYGAPMRYEIGAIATT